MGNVKTAVDSLLSEDMDSVEVQIEDLASTVKDQLADKAMGLLDSGGIDAAKYASQPTLLAKILIKAALKDIAGSFITLPPAAEKEVQNLAHF